MTLDMTPPAFRVGEIEIRQVVEMQFPFLSPDIFLPSAPKEAVLALRDQFEPWALCPQSGKLILALQSYVVRTSRHTILVDTCIGCQKDSPFDFWHLRTDDGWLRRLVSVGVLPETVDYVFCTHLHGDHVGWNTQLRDGRFVPTFPNAKYVFARKEVEFAQAAAPERLPAWEQSVLPVLEAGQALLVDTDFALDDEVWLQHTPGHTPGHVAVHLTSKGKQAVLTGDVIHSPLQCVHPDWSALPDVDKSQAAKTRRAVLLRSIEEEHLLLTSHFPLPSVGRVKQSELGFDFHYTYNS